MSFIDDDMSELLFIESRVRAGVVERREMVSNYNDITGKNSQYSRVCTVHNSSTSPNTSTNATLDKTRPDKARQG